MGRNDEYSRDAYQGDQYVYDSDDSDEFENELDPETWQDWYSQELLDGWMYLRDYFDQNYIRCRAGFPDFCDLIMDPSRWHQDDFPSEFQELLWRLVSQAPIVTARVQPENFYAWVENYIDYL